MFRAEVRGTPRCTPMHEDSTDSVEQLSHKLAAGNSPRLHRFDMRAFHAALDAARQAKGLSWAELAAETNRPLEGTTSIPIHPATLRGMLNKRSVTSAVVLQTLAWLGRTPESFLTGFPRVMLLTQWVGQPAAHFVRVRPR